MAKWDVTDASGVRRGTGKETGQGFCQVWLSWVVAPREGLGKPFPVSFPPQPWARSQGWPRWAKDSGTELGTNGWG